MSKNEMRYGGAGQAVLLSLLILASIISGQAVAEDFNLCGCKGHPQSLGDFDPAKQKSWPPALMPQLKAPLS